MPLQKLTFRPGVNREGTDYANEGGWYDCDKIRFRSGFPEKIGGWIRLSSFTYDGVARSLWNWIDLDGTNYLGVGTNLKYYIEKGGFYYDITPIRKTVNPMAANPFASAFSTLNGAINATATTITLADASSFPNSGGIIKIDSEQMVYNGVSSNTLTGVERGYNGTTAASHTTGANVGCATITVTDTSNGVVQDDFVTFSGATAFAGFATTDLNAEQQVYRVINSSKYTFNVDGVFSTSQASGGGSVIIAVYQINTGLDVYVIGNGWGAGVWPVPAVFTLTNPFATTSGSGTVVVTHTAHGLTNGQYVRYAGATAVGGLSGPLLNRSFAITYINANSYSIAMGNNGYGTAITASSTTSGGGTVTAYYQSGTRGWGQASVTTGVGQQLRLWTNDNFGQNLVIAPRNGAIYYWLDNTGVSARAELLSELSTSAGFSGQFVPNQTLEVSASSIQRFVIAFGANPYDPTDADTAFDPMLVRWSDQENPYQWVPDVTNQSGEFRLSNGSTIVTSINTRQEILIWTDSALYSMQYLGPPYVYKFEILMDNISIISPNSAITINNITYWMGDGKFYQYSGRVETLPCSLRQYIFNDINKDQSYQIFAGGNEGYNEVWWFYCSTNSNVVDKYVIYNYLDKVWYYGTMSRTAWLDSGIRQFPMAADYNERVLYHESNVDDVAGLTPVPINAFIQSSDFDIGDGHNFGFVWRILPDVNFNGSNVNQPFVTMTIKPRQNSGAPYGVAANPTVQSADNYGASRAYNIQEFDGQVYTRLRGRQMAFRIESDTLGVSWQLGTPRIDIRNDGRR
jgi:protein involved in ribonucleotide reduction